MTTYTFPMPSIAEVLMGIEASSHTDGPAPTRNPRMKRMSLAEHTLKKQYDRILADEHTIETEITLLKVRQAVLWTQRTAIETERYRLERARKVSRAYNKSKP